MKKLFLKLPLPLLIPITAMLIVSCGPSKEEIEDKIAKAESKYKPGEIIYLKPDNCKAVIIRAQVDYDSNQGVSIVGYYVRDCHGQYATVHDPLIYGKKPSNEQ